MRERFRKTVELYSLYLHLIKWMQLCDNLCGVSNFLLGLQIPPKIPLLDEVLATVFLR